MKNNPIVAASRPSAAALEKARPAGRLSSPFSFRVSAQSYSVDWHKLAGGGGTSTNGQYCVNRTNSVIVTPLAGSQFFRLFSP